MDLSTVEQCVGDAVEEVGGLIGKYLLGEPEFGVVVREQMGPVIKEAAVVCGECFNAAAVMADATQPIGTES